jgi:hypothetical protein
MVKRSVAENRPVCIAEELLLFGIGHSQPPRVTYGANRNRYIGAWIQTFCVLIASSHVQGRIHGCRCRCSSGSRFRNQSTCSGGTYNPWHRLTVCSFGWIQAYTYISLCRLPGEIYQRGEKAVIGGEGRGSFGEVYKVRLRR